MLHSRTELARMARLAKLSLPAEEEEGMLDDLSDLVKVAQSIGHVDLTGFDCSGGGDADTSGLRDDVLSPSTPVDALLSSAADARDGYFCGPR